jgi:hypothetical protein
MIVCTEKQTAFLHIPKCAGQTVRRQIEHHHDVRPRFNGRWQRSDNIDADLAHLPFCLIRTDFPEAYEALKKCSVFALIRDPVDRFRSALAQHTKKFQGSHISTLSEDKLRATVSDIIDELGSTGPLLPFRLAHFVRQSDMLPEHDEVHELHLYRFEKLPLMMGALGTRLGQELGSGYHDNRSTPIRFEYLRQPLVMIASKLSPIVSKDTYQAIKRTALYLITDNSRSNINLYKEEWLLNFIYSYYKDDYKIFNSLKYDTESVSTTT